MSGSGARIQTYSDIVTVPATKTAGTITIFQSDAMYPFENGSWDKAVVHMIWDDASKITDTITVKPYVTWNDGDSVPGDSRIWKQIGTYDEFVNGSGSGDTYHVIPFCPRLRVDIAFDASGALTADHGLQVDISFYERSTETRRTFQFNSLANGDTSASRVGDSIPTGDSVYGDSFDMGASAYLQVYTQALDRAEIGDTLYLAIQHKQGSTGTWQTYDTVAIHALSNGTGAWSQRDYIGNEGNGDTTGLYRYVRAHLYTDDSELSYVESMDNIFVHLVAIEK